MSAFADWLARRRIIRQRRIDLAAKAAKLQPLAAADLAAEYDDANNLGKTRFRARPGVGGW